MNKYLRAGLLFLLPSKLSKYIFEGGKCGFSLILVDDFEMAKDAKIGHFNIIKCHYLKMEERSKINHLNTISGNFDIVMGQNSVLMNLNRLAGVRKSKCYCTPCFMMHKGAKIMSRHFFDLIQSIEIGERSIFAGARSQCWTHSYLYGKVKHARLDGKITIGKNSYIGASCILLPGIEIGNDISLGAGTVCSKSISEAGLYVSSCMRHIPFDADDRIASLGKPEAVIDGVERYCKQK